MFKTTLRRPGIPLLALVAALTLVPPASAQFTLPSQFVDDLVLGGLSMPVGMAYLPDGRLLVIEQVSAKVRLVVNGALGATDPVVTVANVNTSGNERGLLGIAVDPGWPTRPYIYVQYDHSGDSKINISRFTVGGDLSFTGNGALTIDPATRYDILTDLPDNASNHNGGTLRFGPDGMLYSSLGDDASGCPAQDLTVMVGKILRLDVSGLPAGPGGPPSKASITPSDNPFVANANANAKLVGFSGLRNPFRFAIDRVTGNVLIGDVGENQWEEIDYLTTLGRSLEWPVKEAYITGPSTCPGADASFYTPPIYAYDHDDGRAVVGGVVYRRPSPGPNRFPPEYEGDIFFNDFYSPWLRRLKGSGTSWNLVPTPGQGVDWASGPAFVSDWATAPDGALTYCAMFTGGGSQPGAIRRIRYTGTTSVPPTASVVDFRAPYPTPTRARASLDYSLAADGPVAVAIYELTGRQVRTLVRSDRQTAGPHHVEWDTRDDLGRAVDPGVYFAQITLSGVTRERRLVVIR